MVVTLENCRGSFVPSNPRASVSAVDQSEHSLLSSQVVEWAVVVSGAELEFVFSLLVRR